MRKYVKLLSCLLAILMTVSLVLTGCGSAEPEAEAVGEATTEAEPAEEPVEEEPAEEVEEPVEEEPERKETITIRAWTPVDWIDVNVWAWQDGGEEVSEWPGEEMWADNEEYCMKLTLPGWVDRVVFSTDGGAIQTDEVSVEPGRDMWVLIFDDLSVQIDYEDPLAGVDLGEMEYVSPYEEDPMYQAAEAGDFETVKSMLPELEDRTILTDWAFNDFNNTYAIEALLSGDYETAIEFFGYCASENDRQYATMFRQLVDGELDAAIDTMNAMEFTNLDSDLGMEWGEIFCMVMGTADDPFAVNPMLMDEYLTHRRWDEQPSFNEEDLAFGENSSWEAEGYVGAFPEADYYIPVDDLSALYAQCGSEANGKVLIVSAQKDFPSGNTYYVIDTLTMWNLSYDLYPSSLSEVEYILLTNYGYNNEGEYKQTFSSEYASVDDYFTFLRMTGQVSLIDPLTGSAIYESPLISGTGEVDAYFSDKGYQCSNMPEIGPYIIEAVEKVRELNGQ